MKVLVLWADRFSTNLGVRALAEGCAALVASIAPDADIAFWNYETPGAPVTLTTRTILKEALAAGPIRRHLAEYDLVVDSRSGDSFTDIYGLRRHLHMSLVGSYAARQRPHVFAPQTFGPFRSRLALLMTKRTSRRSRLFLGRDPRSTKAAAAVLDMPVVGATDVVFTLPVERVPRTRDVLLNVSGLLWAENTHVDSTRYRSVVGELLDALHADGRRVALLAHVIASSDPDNDGGPLRELADHPAVTETLEPQSLEEARAMIASAELVIASRMHACLNALSQGIPAIALEYSDKFAPLMQDLDWSRRVDLRAESI
ncbi:MAG: polysaccharide pyruvyl transferase family protein, partial [Microbacterium sp.]|nr:polysaccharide pyruvyl transferase family protein [Microbacterium sp.]